MTQEVVKACKEAKGEVLTHLSHAGGTRPPLDPQQRSTHGVDRLLKTYVENPYKGTQIFTREGPHVPKGKGNKWREPPPPPCANPHVIVPQAPSLIWNHRRVRAHGQYRTQEVVKACKEAQGEVLTHSLHVGGARPPLDLQQRYTRWVDRLFFTRNAYALSACRKR